MKIGILTGGGDCPGLNPVIRAAVRTALREGYQMIGIRNGWKGLVDNDTLPLDGNAVSDAACVDIAALLLYNPHLLRKYRARSIDQPPCRTPSEAPASFAFSDPQ